MTDAATRGIPRDPEDDYTDSAITARREYLKDRTGGTPEHPTRFSLDPATLAGNVENFFGVAQVPMGLAGPLLVDGEHAQGEFIVPMATTEGTLVASYNRGMRLCREAGGIITTVVDDKMQRAPVFTFESAREARTFSRWLIEHFDQVAAAAKETTSSGELVDIQQFFASKMVYTRFNY